MRLHLEDLHREPAASPLEAPHRSAVAIVEPTDLAVAGVLESMTPADRERAVEGLALLARAASSYAVAVPKRGGLDAK